MFIQFIHHFECFSYYFFGVFIIIIIIYHPMDIKPFNLLGNIHGRQRK